GQPGQDGRGPRVPREVSLALPEEHPERRERAGAGGRAETEEVIAERVAALRERIARAAARAGRKAEDVTLVAVSKTFGPEAVRDGFAVGLRDFGENKVQEAETKIGALEDLSAEGVRWHLVGHLQGNKARKAVPLFDRIHSLDDASLGLRLEHI